MMEPLLWILGCYAACIALVHTIHLVKKPDPARRETWVMITRNHQHKVEWMLRTLLFVSWFKGKAINLYVIDRGSTDDTLHIVSRIAQRQPFPWTVVRSEEELERVMRAWTGDEVNVIDLERADHPQAVPSYR